MARNVTKRKRAYDKPSVKLISCIHQTKTESRADGDLLRNQRRSSTRSRSNCEERYRQVLNTEDTGGCERRTDKGKASNLVASNDNPQALARDSALNRAAESNVSAVVDVVETVTCSASELFLVMTKGVGVSYKEKGNLDVTRKVRTFLPSSSTFFTDAKNCEKALCIVPVQLLCNPTGRHQHTSTSVSSIGT